jgi:carbon-monoxide dehydrogenase large subunit
LEAFDSDIELKDGVFSIVGTNKSASFGEVALKAYILDEFPLEDLEPGLEEAAFYDPANFTYPSGAYCCEVELDPETGKVRVHQFIFHKRD